MKGKTRVILWGIIGVMLVVAIYITVSKKPASETIQDTGNQPQIVQQIETLN